MRDRARRIAAVAISPTTFGLNQGLNGASSGRGGLVSGGLSLFADRPLWGYGSGSFVTEYRAPPPHDRATTLSASHTIPITIAAEQGLIGELVYLALVARRARVAAPAAPRGDPRRAAIGAAFVALLFHTLLYADFLEDPITWALLAIGVALARCPAPGPRTLSRRAPAGDVGPSCAGLVGDSASLQQQLVQLRALLRGQRREQLLLGLPRELAAPRERLACPCSVMCSA